MCLRSCQTVCISLFQYHVYPASDLAMVQELSPSLYMFTADAATSTLTGYGMVVEDSVRR